MKLIRKSVPTLGVSRWWECGWAYVMPDFDNPGNSFVEWLGDKAPVEPKNVLEEHQTARTA